VKLNPIEKAFGSGFFTGYIKGVPGTYASIAALLIYWIPGFENPLILISAIVVFFFYGIHLGSRFEKFYGEDPKECTIDEFVGMWIALLFLPKKPEISILAFIIWRIADIIKPFPANKLEKIGGGLGIMLDDLVAGLYSLMILHAIVFISSL
jgi:phosphatidylglycerophosphatase A